MQKITKNILFCSVSDGKSCFSVKKIDFDQQTACGAPICWLKYTTREVEIWLACNLTYIEKLLS